MSDFQTVDMNEWKKMERTIASQLRTIERLAKHRQNLEIALKYVIDVREIKCLHKHDNFDPYCDACAASKVLKDIKADNHAEGVRSSAENARLNQDVDFDPPWDESDEAEQAVLDEKGARADVDDALHRGYAVRKQEGLEVIDDLDESVNRKHRGEE